MERLSSVNQLQYFDEAAHAEFCSQRRVWRAARLRHSLVFSYYARLPAERLWFDSCSALLCDSALGLLVSNVLFRSLFLSLPDEKASRDFDTMYEPLGHAGPAILDLESGKSPSLACPSAL